MCVDKIYSLEHLVALGSHVEVAEFDEELDHVQRRWRAHRHMPLEVRAMFDQTQVEWQAGRRRLKAETIRVIVVQWFCGEQLTHTRDMLRLACCFELLLVYAHGRGRSGERVR